MARRIVDLSIYLENDVVSPAGGDDGNNLFPEGSGVFSFQRTQMASPGACGHEKAGGQNERSWQYDQTNGLLQSRRSR
jgi:hypothetical protein